MRRLALIFIFLISLSLITESAKAEQIEYLGFEGFASYVEISSPVVSPNLKDSSTYSHVASYVLALPNQKYLEGQYFKVKVNYSDIVGTGTIPRYDIFQSSCEWRNSV